MHHLNPIIYSNIKYFTYNKKYKNMSIKNLIWFESEVSQFLTRVLVVILLCQSAAVVREAGPEDQQDEQERPHEGRSLPALPHRHSTHSHDALATAFPRPMPERTDDDVTRCHKQMPWIAAAAARRRRYTSRDANDATTLCPQGRGRSTRIHIQRFRNLTPSLPGNLPDI